MAYRITLNRSLSSRPEHPPSWLLGNRSNRHFDDGLFRGGRPADTPKRPVILGLESASSAGLRPILAKKKKKKQKLPVTSVPSTLVEPTGASVDLREAPPPGPPASAPTTQII